MRVLVAPLMAMAESAGPATRARALASAMSSRGWKTTLCVPEGFRGTVPADVSPQDRRRACLRLNELSYAAILRKRPLLRCGLESRAAFALNGSCAFAGGYPAHAERPFRTVMS